MYTGMKEGEEWEGLYSGFQQGDATRYGIGTYKGDIDHGLNIWLWPSAGYRFPACFQLEIWQEGEMLLLIHFDKDGNETMARAGERVEDFADIRVSDFLK